MFNPNSIWVTIALLIMLILYETYNLSLLFFSIPVIMFSMVGKNLV